MANNLILGFGGSAAFVLSFVKELTKWKRGSTDDVKFLLFDTIKDWKPGAEHKLQGGRESETIAKATDAIGDLDAIREYYPLQDTEPTLQNTMSDPSRHLTRRFEDWLNVMLLTELVPPASRNLEEGAAQQRQIGRYAIFRNAGEIVKNVKAMLAPAQNRVWLVASAAGGTGAGCLLDAAFLVRYAAMDAGRPAPGVTGIVILPAVYTGIGGVEKARAYALFREINRFQATNWIVPAEDSYGVTVAEVAYDDIRSFKVAVDAGGLFDHLFYVGTTCRTKDERHTFFTSVAAAIEPHLDPETGDQLLNAAVNEAAGNVASFGGSRVYLPVETLKGLFAWEAVRSVLEALTAPIVTEKQVVDVRAGNLTDRQMEAEARFVGLLPYFGRVLQLKDQNSRDAAARGLDPFDLVEVQLQCANPAQAGFALTPDERRTVSLTYCNPYLSVSSPEHQVKPADYKLKTYAEEKTAGIKKTYDVSRDDFGRALTTINATYVNDQAPVNSFARGATVIRSKLSETLRRRIDEGLIQAFEEDGIGGGRGSEQGTNLTREYKRLQALLTDDGPVKRARQVIRRMRDVAKDARQTASDDALNHQKSLTAWTPPRLGKGGALTSVQAAARTAAGDALRAYQREHLLRLIDDLLGEVEARFKAWYEALHRALSELVLLPGNGSAWGITASRLETLEDRLGFQAQNPQALIDPINALQKKNGDLGLHGYREELRQQTTQLAAQDEGRMSIAEDCVRRSRWTLKSDPAPSLELQTTGSQPPAKLADIAGTLSGAFQQHIATVLDTKTIFDYLLHCQRQDGRATGATVGAHIHGLAAPLITLDYGVEVAHLVHPEAVGEGAVNYLDAAAGAVGGVVRLQHTDRFSIGILRFKLPHDSGDIQDIKACQQEYLAMQVDQLNKQQDHDKRLKRSAAFHIFRAEVEAWYVERTEILKAVRQPTPDSHIPPRVSRLLGEPDQFQAFVACLATEAVRQEADGWWWTKADGVKLRLNDPSEGNPTLIRAAVNFVLKQGEGLDGSLQKITLKEAQQSAVQAAATKGRQREEMLKDFVATATLKAFLDRAFPDRGQRPTYAAERQALERLIQFYAEPGRAMALKTRTV